MAGIEATDLPDRFRLLGMAALVVAAGLLLRLGPWRAPLWLHHFGVSLAWGAMVFLLVAALRPGRWGWIPVLAVASGIAVAVELGMLAALLAVGRIGSGKAQARRHAT